MPITKDLKADEIEITYACKEPDCTVVVTWAHSNYQVKIYGLPALKGELRKSVQRNHKNGTHDRQIKEYRDGR